MKKIVVVIDDVETILLCLKYSLEKIGYIVHTFRKPIEALKYVPALQPDIVVVDYLMFDCSGLELIPMLRALGVNCPYILFTSIYEEEVPERCTEMNVTFLDKKNFVKDVIPKLIGDPDAD
jgi:CheY-like chemotaxis protein